MLFTLGANMVTGCRASALHPLGSVDDHAYVIDDAEIETLVFDPSFAERARQLQERCPKLTRLLSFGPCDVGDDLLALAAKFSPQPLVAPNVQAEDVAGFAYTGGTTGKPKGVMGTYRSGATMTMIQMAEWEWPEDTRFLICTPLSHAGAAFFIPTLLTGGAIVVLPHFDPGLVLETIEKYKITATMIVPTMFYVLLDHPKLDADRHVEPADRLLRRGRVLADAAAGGDPPARPDLLPVLRPGRVPDGDHVVEEGRPRRERPRPARHVRAADAVGEGAPARRRPATRCRAASRARSACRARS